MSESIFNVNDMPLGLGMALAKNIEAMNYFSNLTKPQQMEVIEHTHEIRSKQEMQDYVDSLPGSAIG